MAGEQASNRAAHPGMMAQLEELQSRVAHLEELLLPEAEAAFDAEAALVEEAVVVSEAAAPAVTAETALPPTQAESTATADEADLRALQREATADLEDSWQSASNDDAPRPRPSFDLALIEERLAGRVLAFTGGAALILGAVFFLSLAFSRGWIGPPLQVALGLSAGSIGLLLGGALLLRGDRLVGHVLAAVGLAAISMSFFAATTLYELLPVPVGLAGSLMAASVATLIAIATRSQIVAAFGLVAVLAAPPILGADPDAITFAYMVTVLAGVAVISLWQTWPWLPPLAFVLSAPQLYAWIDSESRALVGAGALLLYWGLMAIAAGGEAFRGRRAGLSLTSAPLLVGAASFVVFIGFGFLPEPGQQVIFLLTLGVLHGIIAAFFMTRRGEVDPFGLLAGALGLGIASMAVPLLFGASLTAVVWSVEAAALAFLAGRRGHAPSLFAALALLSLAAVRLAIEAADLLASWPDRLAPSFGSLDPLVIGLAAFLVAATVFVWSVPNRTVRLVVVSIAVLACLPVVFIELSGVASVAAWTFLAVVAFAAPRWLALLRERPIDWHFGTALEWLRPGQDVGTRAELLTTLTGALAGTIATIATIAETAAAAANHLFDPAALQSIPFTDSAGISALILASGCLAAGALRSGAWRHRTIITAGLIVGIAAVFQVTPLWLVLLWSGLALTGFALAAFDDVGRRSYLVASRPQPMHPRLA